MKAAPLPIVWLLIALASLEHFTTLADNSTNLNRLFPLEAQIRVRTSEFAANAAETPYSVSETFVTLYYSNAWWRMDSVQTNAETGDRIFSSCMTIPGGVRYIVHPLDAGDRDGQKLAAVATACPLSFPTPGHEALFVSWLTFCPRPKLPFINSERIHRPIYTRDCDVSALMHPKNEGKYSISYGGDANAFLSNLRIWNNGVNIEPQYSPPGAEPILSNFPPPFDSGFLEFEFSALSTTNYQGVTFPVHAIVKRMFPAFDVPNSSELFTRVWSEIQLLTVSNWNTSDGIETNLLPALMVAMDFRPDGLPGNTSVDYLITNDTWRESSDPQIVHRAEKLRLRDSLQNRNNGSFVRTVFLVVGSLSLLALATLLMKHQNKTRNEK